MTNVQQISLDKLVNNTGQIAGVPKNPRQIRNEQYDKLLKSLKESDLTDYKPLMVYPLGDKYVCLGGNMRLRALRELKAETVSCIIVPEGTPAEMLRKLVIIDNTEFGEYDWDAIANEWDADALSDWGVETPVKHEKDEDIQGEEDFAEILNEKNNYIVLQFRSDVDWLQVESFFGLERRRLGSLRLDGKIRKSTDRYGVARVIDGARFLNSIIDTNK